MPTTAAELCTRALIALGARPIASLEETGVEAQVCRTLYPGLRDTLLTAHPWSFATAQAGLPRLAALPVADFRHAFQLPDGFLRALSAGRGPRGRGLEYRIAENRLHANAGEVVLTYIHRMPESEFPAFFQHALTARLAAEFCLPITESISRAEALMRIAEGAFQQAKQIDSQQDAPPRIEDFALFEARW